MSSCNRLTIMGLQNKVAKLYPWELQDLPPGDYDGEFKPNSRVLLEGAKEEYYMIIIDLPGMKESDEILDPKTEPPLDRNWYRFSFSSGDVTDPGTYKTVEGYMTKQFAKESKHHGYFSVRFAVPPKYSSNFLKLENGRLIIGSCLQEYDGRGNIKQCAPHPVFREV
jgi:hypothetical protein